MNFFVEFLKIEIRAQEELVKDMDAYIKNLMDSLLFEKGILNELKALNECIEGE